jgi:AcrR family transcriptional regulator
MLDIIQQTVTLDRFSQIVELLFNILITISLNEQYLSIKHQNKKKLLKIQSIKSETMSKKPEIRTKILDAAQEVFTKYGYGKTTMDDIAREMGKGKSSIYYYFTSKEDIFKAVVEKEILLMKTKILTAVSAKEDPQEQLKAYVQERMHGLKSLKNLYNVIRTEFISQGDFVGQTRQQTDQEEINIVSGILNKGVEKGTFHLEDTLLTAIAIVTALKGMEIPLVITENGGDNLLEQRLDRLLDVLFFGIIKR